jgi:F-type H+-transporting ATPase subunit b
MLLWQLVLIQVITFVVLAVLLHQFLYRQVTRSLGRLQQLYQENLAREEELKKRREEMEQELRTRMAKHTEEIARLRAEAEAAVQEMRDGILTRAKEEGRKIVAEADAGRERMRASLVAAMEEQAVGLASDIVGRVLTGPVAQGIHAELIEDLIEEIGTADGPRPELAAETAEAAVAFPLTPAQHARLQAIFAPTPGRSFTIKETIDETLLAGMVIRLDNLVLDGSLHNKLKGMLAYVRENLSR